MVEDDDIGTRLDSFGVVVVGTDGTGLALCDRFRNGLFPPTDVMRLKIENAVVVVGGGGDDGVVRCSIACSAPWLAVVVAGTTGCG